MTITSSERRRYVRKGDGAGRDLIEDIARGGQAGSAEEDPADQNEVEGRQTAQNTRAARERQFRIAVQRLPPAMRREPDAVPGAPDQKGPAGAVPQAADHHGDHEIQIGEDLPAGAQAGQREIEIIAQPVGERNVPATPKVGNVLGGVRAIEVARERDAEQQRGADRDVGVAGEIVVKLERVAVDAGQHFGAGVELGQIEDAIHQGLSQEIGDQELLHQTQADQEQRLASVLRG